MRLKNILLVVFYISFIICHPEITIFVQTNIMYITSLDYIQLQLQLFQYQPNSIDKGKSQLYFLKVVFFD